jgi:alanyl-tRNA synthetase
LDSHELREAFLRFFEGKHHRIIPSAPIVPPGDPTLLFNSAGMVPFKQYFMGQARPPSRRLASVQKCFRTTDIESVGDTSHLTFFEMLGNFSIGDYFKAEIIPWAWEFLTEGIRLDRDRLWPAVYKGDDGGEDKEAYDIWVGLGVPKERILRYGDEHNYWYSGDVGPCGPDSEIHYDFGEQFGCGPDCEPAHDDCERFVEIWNLVFMSFYCDGEVRTPLPSKNVDTGAGLERITSVLLFESDGWDKNKLVSVYDTDLFQPIIKRIENLSGKRYGEDEAIDRAMRIVAEHARAVTFLVGDERTPVVPSNEERGYVVRRMLRRAVYFGRRRLGIEGSFMTEIAKALIQHMGPSHPELERQRGFIEEIIAPEERRFDETLSRGLELLEAQLAKSGSGIVPGDEAFLLHDTYGFPIELTREIAVEHGFEVDEAGFEAEMEKQRERARAGLGSAEAVAADTLYSSLSDSDTVFRGYDALESKSEVLALLKGGRPVESAEGDGPIEVLLTETSFYPEGGGQVGDSGEIVAPNGRVAVEDTQRVAGRLIVHRGSVAEGRIVKGDAVTARVGPQHREDTMRNHTATHLAHAALRKVLGTHVRQAGSLVAPDYMRFDFTHTEAVTPGELAEVSRLVNAKIRQNLSVDSRTTTFDEAMSEGVLAFFGDKYGEEVRVVEVNTVVPKFSAELCGGTHCHRTGDIGSFVITGESSIGAGMRRIEALTGRGAEEYVRERLISLDEIAGRLGAPKDALSAKVDSLLAEQDALRKRVEKLERSLATAPTLDDVMSQAVEIDGIRVVAASVEAPSADALRYRGDAVRNGLGSGVAVLASVVDERPMFIAIVTKDVIDRGPKAGEILKRVASVTGGGGGGRPDMAQGGGRDASKVGEALAIVPDLVREMLGSK